MENFNIDDLNIQDDLAVAVNPETYVDPQMPLPLADGRYGFRIVDSVMRRDKEGNLVLQDGKYPILTIKAIDVIVPTENARKNVILYQDVTTKPRPRMDRSGGNDSGTVTELGDLIRSGDASARFSGIKEGLALLQSLIAQNTVFHARFQWEASDRTAINEELDKLNAEADAAGTDKTSKAFKDAKNAIYKLHTRRGMRNFKNDAGNVVPFFVGVDGERVEARTRIAMEGYIPQTQLDQVKLGPTAVR